jgi:hypothetical protein
MGDTNACVVSTYTLRCKSIETSQILMSEFSDANSKCIINRLLKMLEDYSNHLREVTEYLIGNHLEEKIPEKGIHRIILEYLNVVPELV